MQLYLAFLASFYVMVCCSHYHEYVAKRRLYDVKIFLSIYNRVY